MISKELLNEVLQKEAEIGDKSILGESYVEYKIVLPGGGKIIRDVNIYELAYKCKEWAYKRGFLIGSNCRQGITAIDINTHIVLNHFDVDIEDFTEFEIKACQWILENK